MTRLGLTAVLLITLGCGPRRGPAPPAPQPQPAVAEVGRLQVALRPRATQGLVRASLWLDAGSRDGAAPAVATPEELEALAHKDSGLHTIIVTNPSTYVTTCEWIRAQGSPQVDQVYLKWDAVTEGRFSRRSRE